MRNIIIKNVDIIIKLFQPVPYTVSNGIKAYSLFNNNNNNNNINNIS